MKGISIFGIWQVVQLFAAVGDKVSPRVAHPRLAQRKLDGNSSTPRRTTLRPYGLPCADRGRPRNEASRLVCPSIYSTPTGTAACARWRPPRLQVRIGTITAIADFMEG